MADYSKNAGQGIQCLMSVMLSELLLISLFSQFEKVNLNSADQTGNSTISWFLGSSSGLIRTDLGELGEDPESAAIRELREETGLSVAPGYIEQLRTYGNPDRDPRNRVISIAHMGIGPTLENPTGGSDAVHAEFVPVEYNRTTNQFLTIKNYRRR